MRTIAFLLPYLGLYRVNVEDDISPAAALESALRQHVTPHPHCLLPALHVDSTLLMQVERADEGSLERAFGDRCQRFEDPHSLRMVFVPKGVDRSMHQLHAGMREYPHQPAASTKYCTEIVGWLVRFAMANTVLPLHPTIPAAAESALRQHITDSFNRDLSPVLPLPPAPQSVVDPELLRQAREPTPAPAPAEPLAPWKLLGVTEPVVLCVDAGGACGDCGSHIGPRDVVHLCVTKNWVTPRTVERVPLPAPQPPLQPDPAAVHRSWPLAEVFPREFVHLCVTKGGVPLPAPQPPLQPDPAAVQHVAESAVMLAEWLTVCPGCGCPKGACAGRYLACRDGLHTEPTLQPKEGDQHLRPASALGWAAAFHLRPPRAPLVVLADDESEPP